MQGGDPRSPMSQGCYSSLVPWVSIPSLPLAGGAGTAPEPGAPSLRRPRSLGWEQAKALPGCAATSLPASRWDLGTVIGSCAPSAEPGTHGHCLTQLHVWDFVLTFHFQGACGPLQLVL